MTTLVDSEDHADAVLMGYDGATQHPNDRVKLLREHGVFYLFDGEVATSIGDMQAEYIARAILKALGK